MGKSSAITARAPSNIAIVKYMGKSDEGRNLPANGSLSMTLDSLCTYVELTPRRESAKVGQSAGSGEFSIGSPATPSLVWVDEVPRVVAAALGADAKGASRAARVPQLNEAAWAKVLRHYERVGKFARESFPQHDLARARPLTHEFRTANTFPAASGIASSASSFAAMTLAFAASFAKDRAAFNRVWLQEAAFRGEWAKIARQGSGSSCRSFEGPWVRWESETVTSLGSRLPKLADLVIVIGDQAKDVSSSEAHRRVLASPLWAGRTERVAQRLVELEQALITGNLAEVSRIAWAETWEMHSLFHTCAQPFTYWKPGTLRVLRWFMQEFTGGGQADRPIVTLDAGPNVHVLVPSTEAAGWKKRLRKRFPKWDILTDEQGHGARLL